MISGLEFLTLHLNETHSFNQSNQSHEKFEIFQ